MARAMGVGVVTLFSAFLLNASAGEVGDFPKGTFTAKLGDDDFAVKIDGKGKFVVTQNKKEFVKGSYKSAKDEVTFTDESGPGAAKEEDLKSGTYKWKLVGDKISFTKVKDKNEGRAKALSVPWTLKKGKK